MDLEDEYDNVERALRKVSKAIESLEDDGDYGSPRYEALAQQELELEAQLDALEDELSR